MKQIRIGNDIALAWRFWTGTSEDREPYDLTGKDLTLTMVDASRGVTHPEFSIDGNAVKFNFYGKDQHVLGKYTLTLVENDGELDMMSIDSINPFCLVARSEVVMKDGETCGWDSCGCSSMELVTLDLDSSLSFTGDGTDNYNALANKPQINDVTLQGNLSAEDLGIEIPEAVSDLDNDLNYQTATQVAASVAAERTRAVTAEAAIAAAIAAKQDNISDLSAIRTGAGKGATSLQPTDILDSLDSTATDKALSANKGRALVDYTDACISDTLAYVDQQDNSEHNGRVAGDNLLDARITVIEGKESGWDAKLGDAPSDGKQYARKNETWTEVEATEGTTDYGDLENKPQIGGVTLSGNKTLAALGIAAASDLDGKQDAISDLSTIRSNAAAGAGAATLLGGHSVGTNVPADAVFTDTVYDDTAVKARLSDIEAQEDGWNDKLDDAPSDGKQYARKDGDWEEVEAGGGSITAETVSTDVPGTNFPYVQYVSQILSSAQKAQVLTNLGISSETWTITYDDDTVRTVTLLKI